jgi:Tol biopolymer transport system component
VYSPDGKYVAFTHRDFQTSIDQPYITRSDGTHTRRLAKSGSPLSFSPDGRRLALTRGGDIYVLTFRGYRLRRLTSNTFDDTDAVFSPDGRLIAFSRRESDTGDFSEVGEWVMRADGTHKHRILTEPSGSLDWQPLGGAQLWRPPS